MKAIILPSHYNYCSAFFSFRCNLNCVYCINRQGEFTIPDEMSAAQWIEGLSRIETREDLPITISGGEPTIHRGFYEIAKNLPDKKLDLLTNGKFNRQEFMGNIHNRVFWRKAPYASIRFSYHKNLNEEYLGDKLEILHGQGYSIGVWGLDNVDNIVMETFCKGANIDFRLKQYLDKNHGTYKYPEAISGERKSVMCKPSELLISPNGTIYRCHADLYAGRNPIGHILGEEILFPDFMACDYFGECNPCDVKLKTNRLQEGGHCSVTIKEDD